MKRVLIKGAATLDVILTVILSLLAPLAFLSVQWIFRTWSHLSMDELIFHLQSPLEGTNTDMVKEYLIECLAPALVIFVVVILFMIFFRKKRWFYVFDGVLLIVFILIIGVSINTTVQKLDVDGYLESQGSYSEFIDTYYVDPANTMITFPEQKRNLIYIFLESMEATYADTENGGAFKENVIPELTELAQENEDFSGEDEKLNGAYASAGATWTMGAMFAHTSGLPLNVSIDENNMDTQEHFFPGIITLGDILSEEGYSQTLLIGSDATFGGRRLYFTDHGNYDIIDYPYAIENGMIPQDHYVWWGYEDYYLFDFAKEKLEELSDQGNPFNLTMLTVDTHFEDGYLCNKCTDTYGADQYSNVMACSSRQIGEFIQWIQQQDFYENTTVVLVGDHLTMDADYCEDISEEYERKTYVSYINAPVENKTDITREYATLDLFPTTLAALGAEIDGNRLGLGTNLFSSDQTLTERFGIDQMDKELRKKSKMMEELADIDKDSKALMIREGRVPKATITAGEYQRETGLIPVSVTNIENVTNGIQSVQMIVWTKADQSDQQWIPMGINEDGTYTANINVMSYGFYEGEYQIYVYVVDGNGEQSVLGTAVGIVN